MLVVLKKLDGGALPVAAATSAYEWVCWLANCGGYVCEVGWLENCVGWLKNWIGTITRSCLNIFW